MREGSMRMAAIMQMTYLVMSSYACSENDSHVLRGKNMYKS